MHYRWTTFDDLSAAQLYELLAFRQDVFIVEQASPYQDLDGLDPGCWHLLVRERPGGPLVGCLRARGPEGDEPAFIGRIVVAPGQRGTGLGRRLVAEGIALLTRLHPLCDIRIGAQAHLEDYYAGFGFVRDGEVYDDGGVPHVTMWRRTARDRAAA